MTKSAKEQLVSFLDERAFQPVLRVREEDVPASKRDGLRHVKRATHYERERFRSYESAELVVQMYREDVTADEGRDVDGELRSLGLPTLADCRTEFEERARGLGLH